MKYLVQYNLMLWNINKWWKCSLVMSVKVKSLNWSVCLISVIFSGAWLWIDLYGLVRGFFSFLPNKVKMKEQSFALWKFYFVWYWNSGSMTNPWVSTKKSVSGCREKYFQKAYPPWMNKNKKFTLQGWVRSSRAFYFHYNRANQLVISWGHIACFLI